MTKAMLIWLLLLAFVTPVFSQFNPATAEKSLVKVMVSADGKMGICSGFLWKKKSWVVTSLHAMRTGGKIQIVYPGNNVREAKVIKVFTAADLVLLETNIEAKPVTNEVIALTTFQQGQVVFGEKIYAIGYNGGSKGNQTQALEKGHANPETLEFLVRAEDKASLTSVGFPSMSLPIYFLSGSLLPGFSGSPIYNQKGVLIGIGDGGLERGLMNVSWCIPASNLTALESSTETTLPATLGKAGLLYSAEVSITVPTEVDQLDYTAMQQQVDKKYESFSYGNFTFFQTKTRTWEEMKRTSIDPENMDSLSLEFKEGNLNIDYDVLDFDIYEDANNGFAIAIPAGMELTYDNEQDVFSVDLTNFLEGQYFDLFYYLTEHDGNPVNDIVNDVKSEFSGEVGGLTLDEKYTKANKINDSWTADYRLFTGDESYVDEELGEVGTFFYLNVIHNDKVAFYSLAIAYIPTSRADVNKAFDNGIDCVNYYDDNATSCDFFESFMQIIASAHLSTKSSLY